MLTTHYMEEADQLCDRVAIMDHGKILALDTPSELKRSVGPTPSSRSRPRRRRRVGRGLEREVDGVTRVRAHRRWRTRVARQGRRSSCCSPGGGGRRRRWVPGGRSVGDRADTRDRVHQPDRKGLARLMTTTTRSVGSHIATAPDRRDRVPSRRPLRGQLDRPAGPVAPRPGGAAQAPSPSSSSARWSSRSLLCFVFLYVFPKIGQSASGGAGAAAPSRPSPPCSYPAWWASRSCSRACSRWPCKCPRSSASPVRSRTGSRHPCPIWLVAMAKVLAGVIQGIIAAVIVLPIASVVHAKGVEATSQHSTGGS
jgi:hypothetical protein